MATYRTTQQTPRTLLRAVRAHLAAAGVAAPTKAQVYAGLVRLYQRPQATPATKALALRMLQAGAAKRIVV